MTPVALVFVSTDEGKLLIPALESLYGAPPRRPLEIVVVDNASRDGAARIIAARWPEVQVLAQPRRRGLPANLNTGIRATVSPYVMACNPDVIFRHGAVDTLASFLDGHPRVGIAAPKLLSSEGELRPSARRWYTVGSLVALKVPWVRGRLTPTLADSVYADWDYASPRRVDWVPCPATMIRREALEEVGMMDERFHLYFDDVDVSLRMHEAGWEVWCVPDSEVVHLEQRASVRPFSRPWRWHLASLVKFLWKHKGLGPRDLRP